MPDVVPDLIAPLQQLHRQPAAGVPRNVAVQEPDARVVAAESDSEPAAGGEEGDVAPRRVVVVEGQRVGQLVVRVGAAAQDGEVVPVQVDRVRGLDNAAVAGAGDWEGKGLVCGYDDVDCCSAEVE